MLSYQHKASDEAEKQRIIAGGGVVYENFGSWRVAGMLEVTYRRVVSYRCCLSEGVRIDWWRSEELTRSLFWL